MSLILYCKLCSKDVAELNPGSKVRGSITIYCQPCQNKLDLRIEELELELKKLKAIRDLGNQKPHNPFGNIFGDIFK